MPGTGAIIPHVVEVEARDDVRVVVDDGPWPVDPALRAGGAAHLAALRRRVPAMHDGPVLAMTAVERRVVRARRAGYFDMVATADALAGDPALRARAVALAGEDPLRRGDGRVAAMGLSVAARCPTGACCSGAGAPSLPLDPGAWHVVPSGMLEPEPDPIGAAVAREALEELGVAADPRAVRMLGSAGTSRACARGVRRARAGSGSGAGGRRRVRRRRGVRGRAAAPRAAAPASGARLRRAWPAASRADRALLASGASRRAGRYLRLVEPSDPEQPRSASRWPPCAGGRPTATSPCSPGSATRARRSCSPARSPTSTRASRSTCRAAGGAIRATAGSFVAERVRVEEPAGEPALLAYLGSVKHVGPRGAAWLLERHGPEQVLAAIDRDPSARLREVPGHRARGGSARRCARGRSRARCARCGCSSRSTASPPRWPRASTAPTARAPSRRCARTRTRLTEVDGIGFATADALAQALGTPPDAPGRLDAGLRHALHEAEGDGHCHLPRAELAERARRLLGADADDRIDELAARGRLVVEGDRVFDPSCTRIETRLARRVRELIDDEPRLRLGAFERPTGDFAPTDAQWAVVRAVLEHRLAILTGGPGTGKTQTMRALVDLLRAQKRTVRLCAPTGKAARRLGEITGAEATTIHRLLEYAPDEGFAPRPRGPDPGHRHAHRRRGLDAVGPPRRRAASARSARARTCCSSATSTSSRRSGPAACSRTSSSRAPCRPCA